MTGNLQNIRSSDEKRSTETFRTPRDSFVPLINYRPEWFVGRGIDPSAGDGRMLREIVRRNGQRAHLLGDIRDEKSQWQDLDEASYFVGDYLKTKVTGHYDFLITNPPFTLAQAFVQKALAEVDGPICILQSVAFQGTAKRSQWLKNYSGLRYVINLPHRPKWQVDDGVKPPPSNIWDFAWFIFQPNYCGGHVTMDWFK